MHDEASSDLPKDLLQAISANNATVHQTTYYVKLITALFAAIRARIKERRGQPELKVFDQNTQKPASSSNCGQLPTILKEHKKGEKTRDHIAKAAGFKNREEMERKEKVKAKAPTPVWDAVKDEVVSVSDAASVADEPAEKQIEALGGIEVVISYQLACMCSAS
ncbi:MAG TPA: hypothetical protein PLX97_04175 [Gemmatales bacterium]|nr:hypothetical protein [Gemmatales bacterium]